jgi:hypothetical protein
VDSTSQPSRDMLFKKIEKTSYIVLKITYSSRNIHASYYYPQVHERQEEKKETEGLVQFSSLGDVTSIPCEKDDRAVISSTPRSIESHDWFQN